MKKPAHYKKIIVSASFVTFLASSLLIGTHPISAQEATAPVASTAPAEAAGTSTVQTTAEPKTPAIEPQNSLTITAIPPRLGDDGSIVLKPGEKKQVEVRINNPGDTPITVETSSRNFVVGEDGSTPITIDGEQDLSNRWSLSSWLTMTPTTQLVRPRVPAIVTVLIEAPKDALPGGHYAIITHKPSLGAVNGKGTNTGVSQEVGTLLYVQVEGPVNEEAYVNDFAFKEMNEFGPVPYEFTIENRSDTHITPQIGITITDVFGRKLEVIQPETKNVFPFTSRKITGEWKKIWGFGPYKAELKMSYGKEAKVVVAYSKFWIFPAKVVIAAILLLLTGIAMIVAIRRHLIHRSQDQSGRIAELEKKIETLQKESLKKYEE